LNAVDRIIDKKKIGGYRFSEYHYEGEKEKRDKQSVGSFKNETQIGQSRFYAIKNPPA
jgi:hypothetical protein